jgi:hypothetical protein
MLEEHFDSATPSSSIPGEAPQRHFSFLDEEDDLVSFRGRLQTSSTADVPLITPLSLVPLIIPLLLFKIFTGIVNRLLIVGLTLAACLFLSGWKSASDWLETTNGAQRIIQMGLLVCACIASLVGLMV